MTKNCSSRQYIVNTMCSNVNEFCQAYPPFNTSSHTNKSLKCVDSPDGLAHKQSQSGRETLPLCPQLGTDYPRPMGLAGNHRVPIRAYPETISGQKKPRDLLLTRRANQNLPRGQGASGQRCHNRSSALPTKLCLPNLSGGEERGRAKACYKPQRSQQLCKDGALQDGGPSSAPRHDPASRLDGEAGPEGRIPPGANTPGAPKSPAIPMAGKNLSVCVPPLRVNISTQGVHKDNETSSGTFEANGNPSGNIPGRHTNNAPFEGGTLTIPSPHMLTIQSLRPDGEPGEIPNGSQAGNGIPGVSGKFGIPTTGIPSRENAENPTGCPSPPATSLSLSEGPGKVCGEGDSYNEGYLASPAALQSPSENDQLGSPVRLTSASQGEQIQHHSAVNRGLQEGIILVDFPGSEPHHDSSSPTPYPGYDHRVRCIQHGLGSPTRGNPDRWCVVEGRSIEPHKLLRTTSCPSSSAMLREATTQHYDTVAAGQCYGSNLHKQDGWDSLTAAVRPSHPDVGVEPTAEYIPLRRAPTREGECDSGRGVQDNEGQMRLDAEPSRLRANTVSDRCMQDRPICLPPDQTAAEIFQLEARPRGGENGCIQPGLVDRQGLCQPPLVFDRSLPVSDQTTECQSHIDYPTMEHTTMVPSSAGTDRELSSLTSSEQRSGSSTVESGVLNEAGGPRSSCMAYIRQSFTSQGISSEASELLLSSWRTKTKSNYNSLFAKWACWCQQRGRDPTVGPVKDVINFLAKLYEQGYQYRSLNSYRSAISSVHSEVDGFPVGQHPLVSRMLKGVFNNRPPLPRYSTFWDVGVVIRHLKQLGTNDSLSLRDLTIKSVTLLALARPSRSMDLSRLDIKSRTFTAEGVVFKPQHLSKQSRPSKPLSDFFYPRFPEDPDVCPVTTLQAYELKTRDYRNLGSREEKTTLFLSWIGKHDPVTSSTIARWLKTCLQEAGIDTGIFKAHSTRGAAASKAALSGVTMSDILQAADWSSESTFQRFYHRSSEVKNKSSFGRTVLASAGTSNLHVDMETEPSEM